MKCHEENTPRKKRTAPPPTEEQLEEMLELFHQKKAIDFIAKKVGVTRYVVLRALEDAGLRIPYVVKVKTPRVADGYFDVKERDWLIGGEEFEPLPKKKEPAPKFRPVATQTTGSSYQPLGHLDC